MSRKTADVAVIRERANRMLETKDSALHLSVFGVTADRTATAYTDATPEQAFRLGVAALLESILHETDNYRGYNHQPGQVTHVGTGPRDLSVITDDTRRSYH